MKVALPPPASCLLPGVLDIIGEKWTCAIIVRAMFGTVHFEDFQANLGIARNILSHRLTRLVEQDILTREVVASDKRRVAYHLTEKGWDFLPAMLALRKWTERWEDNPSPRCMVVDERDRLPIRPLRFYAHDGRLLGYGDILWLNDKGEEVQRLIDPPDTIGDAS